MKTYFTGNPCKHGHITERRLHNRECLECSRISCLKRYYKNRDKNILRMKAYGKTEKEKLRQKKYREANREERINLCAIWHDKNRDKAKKYRQDRKVRYTAHAENRRARVKNAPGRYDESDVVRIIKLQKNKCAYCKTDISCGYHIDHIMPISKGGSNWPKNLQALCAHCNYSKNDTLPEEYARLNGRLL